MGPYGEWGKRNLQVIDGPEEVVAPKLGTYWIPVTFKDEHRSGLTWEQVFEIIEDVETEIERETLLRCFDIPEHLLQERDHRLLRKAHMLFATLYPGEPLPPKNYFQSREWRNYVRQAG
jgi:hypothetical protein